MTAAAKTKKGKKYISVTDILKAGGADAYAVKHGIETQTRDLSGRIEMDREETEKMLDQLDRHK